jgi:hypothetical protein
LAENPGTELWDATADELRALPIVVSRNGGMQTIYLDGGDDGRGIDAVDIVRALRQTYSLSEPDEYALEASGSAESEFFEIVDSVDLEALRVLEACREALEKGNEWHAIILAEQFTLDYELPSEIAENILQEAKK